MEKATLTIIGPDPYFSYGGMASIIKNILNSSYLSNEFNIEIFPSFIDGNLYKRIAYSVFREELFRLRTPQSDLYHIHICSGTSTWRKMRYVKSLREDSNRVILHVHGARYHLFYESCSDREKRKIRNLYNSVAKVIVLSEEWRDYFINAKICDPKKIEVLHNAVEVPEDIKVDYRSNNVLFLGRLGERKSPDVLLKAAQNVLSQHSDARFIFGGDGNVEKYKKIADDLGILEKCEFRGWVSGKEKERLFRKCSIYCLPSKNEGMPMSVLEAMSYGLSTISTSVGGVPQVICDAVNGFIIPVGDAPALSKCLNILMDDKNLKQKIGNAGRQTIIDQFSMQSFERHLSEIYRDVLFIRNRAK